MEKVIITQNQLNKFEGKLDWAVVDAMELDEETLQKYEDAKIEDDKVIILDGNGNIVKTLKIEMEENEMNVMKKAWEIAREGAAKFGGKASEYFAKALKIAWAIDKNEVDEVKEQFIALANEYATVADATRPYAPNVPHVDVNEIIGAYDESRKDFMIEAMTKQVKKAKDYLAQEKENFVQTATIVTSEGSNKNKSWVAEITGTHPRWNLNREFLEEEEDDYRDKTFVLNNGIYEVCDAGDREFIQVENGEIEYIEHEEVIELIA